MQLTNVERVFLRNQLLLLSSDSEYERDYNAYLVLILEGGYEGEYDKVFARISTPVSAEDCTFVAEVLEMFKQIEEALQAHPTISAEDKEYLRFSGFSKVREHGMMRYAEFLLNLNHAEEPTIHHTAVSAEPKREQYRRMYNVWVKGESASRISSGVELQNLAAAARIG